MAVKVSAMEDEEVVIEMSERITGDEIMALLAAASSILETGRSLGMQNTRDWKDLNNGFRKFSAMLGVEIEDETIAERSYRGKPN